MVAQGDVVDHALVHVFHEIDAPDGPPPGRELPAPGQVVGVHVLDAQRQRRVAELEFEVLVLGELVGGRRAEGEALVEVAAELAVVIYVDGRGIILVAADQHGMLSEQEAEFRRGLPVDIHEIRGVEHVLLVEDFLVEPLADAVVDGGRDVAHQVEVQVFSHHLAAVFPLGRLLVERSAHVEIQPFDELGVQQYRKQAEG